MTSVRDLLEAADDAPDDEAAHDAVRCGDARRSDARRSDARREAEILLSHCLGRPRTWLYTWPEAPVPEAPLAAYRTLLARRRRGEPVAYLTGSRAFWSLDLAVSEATLIPRAETELLVAWALELPLPSGARVLDLGTGSGAIALAMAAERPHWAVVALDNSAAALAVARDNAARAGLSRVHFLVSDWYAGVAGRRFDLLVANPPYIDPADAHLRRGDLRFEPRAALVAPEQGLADLRRLAAGAPGHLHDGGWLLLEHGFDQGAAVRDMLVSTGFTRVTTRRDLGGQERATAGQWRAD